jgi:hemolysin D
MYTANSNTNDREFSSEKIRILVVDDQRMIREGLKVLLQSESDFEVVGTAENGKAAIELLDSKKADVVLLDMEMPEMDGVAATRLISERFPQIKVLVLSSYNNDEYVANARIAGAKGYLLKGTPAHEVKKTIRSIHSGYDQIVPGVYEEIIPVVPEVLESKLAETRGGALTKTTAAQTGEMVGTTAVLERGQQTGAIVTSPRGTPKARKFDQAIVLKQPPTWSRAVIWTLVLSTVGAIVWAYFAKIEQVVPAVGQLKPEGSVKDIQAPLNGVVEEVLVKEGDLVEKDQILVKLDSSAAKVDLSSQQSIRKATEQENQFYRTLMSQPLNSVAVEQSIASLNIPGEIAAIARQRVELLEENEIYQAIIQGNTNGINLNAEQLARLRALVNESSSRATSAVLDISQTEKQLSQTKEQIANADAKVKSGRLLLAEIQDRNVKAIAEAEEALAIDKKILAGFDEIEKDGAIAQVQIESQRQRVRDRNKTLIETKANGKVEAERQRQQIETDLSEKTRLQEEEQRLNYAIAQAQSQVVNTQSLSEKEVRDRIAENSKKIAEIDSQLNKTVVENSKTISEVDSRIATAKQTLKYQDIIAPVKGTVFDLQATRGYVPQPGPSLPLMKIVPVDNLIAEVYVSNQDIGFVKEKKQTNQKVDVDVRIDTYDYSNYGDIKGEILSIATEALEPDQTYNYYRFPVKIKLNAQDLKITRNGKVVSLPLQSGMSVSANIKINENRTVMNILLDHLMNGVQAFKEVR